ncbi:MAG: hypothetical protein ACYS15_06755 [Planctomycetota bacterium]
MPPWSYPRRKRGMWTCPKCGRSFTHRGQAHSSVVVSVDGHFAGRPARVRDLFDRFVALAEAYRLGAGGR